MSRELIGASNGAVNGGKSWYVIRTKPQREYFAQQSLEREGYEVFLPRVMKPKPRPNRPDEPLFPGYLFIRYDLEAQNGKSPARMPGVLGWVNFQGVIPPIDDDIVQILARRVEMVNEAGGLWTPFERGDSVRVVSGTLEGLARVVDGAKTPDDRVRVLMHFMGRQVVAKVPWDSLEAVNGEAHPMRRRSNGRRTRGKGRWIRGFGPRVEARA